VYPDALKKEIPERCATNTMGDPIIFMAATKNTARSFVPKSGTCAPMIAHSSDVSKGNRKSIFLGNGRINVDQTKDVINAWRIS
jgi:hypothetical protein